jgi:predicted DNA-binding protein (MmcQ/YjbR family)
MNIEELRAYCLSKPAVEEGFPFDNDTLVFKVAGKMFLAMSLSRKPLRFNAKCDPELAVILREHYDREVIPGYHMNKKMWNTVEAEGSIPEKDLHKMIDHSYIEVVKSLPTKARKELFGLKTM